MSEYTDKLRKICTYHSDDGTSGYLLSEKQFAAINRLILQARREELEALRQHNGSFIDGSRRSEGWVHHSLIDNRLAELDQQIKEMSEKDA